MGVSESIMPELSGRSKVKAREIRSRVIFDDFRNIGPWISIFGVPRGNSR